MPDYYANLASLDSAVVFMASVNDVPSEKERFFKCELKLHEVKVGGRFVKTQGSVLGYFKRSPEITRPGPGQTVLIKADLVELTPPKNPYEFDYKAYLSNKQIYHTVFIDPSCYAVLPVRGQLHSVWMLGLRCKEFLLDRLKNAGLTKNAYGICAALLTGYDDDIDKPVIEAFSHSGTLHVLSVSGLHTGLIYLCLNFLFNFFDRKKRYKFTRFAFITFFLWIFALVTGFSAPVLRAVIMFNLLGFGRIYFRAGSAHQLNILLVSAFVLLLYNPLYIMDIGFLLSYFALFGLIYYQPGLSALWRPENRFASSIWQSVTASVAATLSTLPITLFYFKQFPLWFFVCNVVVVPATFILLFLAVFVVFKVVGCAALVNYLVSALIWFIDLFNKQDTGFIDAIHFTFSDFIFMTLFIILVSVAFQYRSHRYLSLSLILLIIWQLSSLCASFLVKNQSLLTVYNIKKERMIAVKNKTSVRLSDPGGSGYNYSVKPHLISFNYPELSVKKFNVLRSSQELVLFLTRPGFWPRVDIKKVTVLVLSTNFKLAEEDLAGFKNLRLLVADASNNNSIAARAEELSRNFGISFYNTKRNGAYLLSLQ